jgi:iron complex transport system ATP-binding protein
MTVAHLRDVFGIAADLAVCPYSSNPICLSYHLCGEQHA